jgi:hypothetical protein
VPNFLLIVLAIFNSIDPPKFQKEFIF